MERIRVKSSNLSEVGYDQAAKILEIKFKTSGVYEYSNVPENVYSELMRATSLGSYFAKNIKDVYSYRQLK